MLSRIHDDACFIEVDWSILPPGMFIPRTFGTYDNIPFTNVFCRHLNDLDEVLDIGIDIMHCVLDHLKQLSEDGLLGMGSGSWNIHIHVLEPLCTFQCSIKDIQLGIFGIFPISW